MRTDDKKRKQRIEEKITNLNTLGILPADEVQLNIDVIYNSILNNICSVVPINSPRQVVSALRLCYDSEKKEINNNKDVYSKALMSEYGSLPLDDAGFPTDEVEFEAQTAEFLGEYKKIIPGTISITDGKYVDDAKGNIVDATDMTTIVGSINYVTAIFKLTDTITLPTHISYRFDIYNLNTDRNFVKFNKTFVEMFARLYQLDADTAVVLDDFKGLNLKDNIDKILPQVLTQQIDQNIITKYFNQLDLTSTVVGNWDAKTTTTRNTSYKDFGAYVGIRMGKFAKVTGVIPNVIICDALSYNMLRVARGFKYADESADSNSLPKFVGYFSTAKVFVVQIESETGENNVETGKLVITYKGPSEAQSAAVFAPFIPVTLRSIAGGMENNNAMINTNNIYSICGFKIINPELIQGIKVSNISLD